MIRVGTNPVKIRKPPIQPPKEVTVIVIVYIPYLSGYYQFSLDILKLCIESIWNNTDSKFDLLVFDNASCEEVREYLITQNSKGRIQYLISSDENVGIPGAWNISFKAAPGKYIAFSDYDIFYYPNWLNAHLELFEVFPNVGMITGRPIRPPLSFSSSTLNWAEGNKEASILRGAIQSWKLFWRHTRSLGMSKEEARSSYEEGEDILIKFKNYQAFIGAGHFQFVALKSVLEKVIPLPIDIAMGNERLLDKRINDLGLLRLNLTNEFVNHMGNVPSHELINLNRGKKKNEKELKKNGLLHIPIIKKSLLKIFNIIFDIYFR